MKFWNDILLPALKDIINDILNVLPNIIAALIILIIGWFIAKLLENLVRRILEKIGFNRAAEKSGVITFLKNAGIQQEPTWILGRIVFWMLLLIFLLSSAEALQLRALADTLQQLVSFIPNIIAVIFILVFGIMLAKIVGRLVQGVAADIGIDFSTFLGTMITNVVIIVIFVLAIAQLRIESSVLDITFAVLLGAFALAVAIALGVGSVNVSKNIISGVYARKIFKIGQKVHFEGNEGEIVFIGTINSQLKIKKGFLNFPNQFLVEQITKVDE